jgi:hypothetical protein
MVGQSDLAEGARLGLASIERQGGPIEAWIVDDTGFAKKGSIPAALPIRPERHVTNSIATIRKHLTIALAKPRLQHTPLRLSRKDGDCDRVNRRIMRVGSVSESSKAAARKTGCDLRPTISTARRKVKRSPARGLCGTLIGRNAVECTGTSPRQFRGAGENIVRSNDKRLVD